MVPAGAARHPWFGVASGAGLQILGIEFVESGLAELKFQSGGGCAQFSHTEPRENVPDQWRCESMKDLWLFIGESEQKKAFFA